MSKFICKNPRTVTAVIRKALVKAGVAASAIRVRHGIEKAFIVTALQTGEDMIVPAESVWSVVIESTDTSIVNLLKAAGFSAGNGVSKIYARMCMPEYDQNKVEAIGLAA